MVRLRIRSVLRLVIDRHATKSNTCPGEDNAGHDGAVPENTPAGRYSPSPTGDLHLGNLRTAVLAWLFARSTGRAFLLRFEDLDASRVRPGVAARQRADLEALGLDFDGVPVVQSQRLPAYEGALTRLADQTFECFCTRREIAEAASAPHGLVARYPGTCRELSEAMRAERRRTRSPALRLRARGVRQTVHDLVHGDVTAVVDDVVLRRNDGTPAYNLAVVVDDVGSGVNQVVRGDDLLAAAASQAHLADLLGAEPPVYAHVPLALNDRGERLAKRDGAVTLGELGAHGLSAARVLTLIAASLDLAEAGEPVDLPTLLHRFEPARIPRHPWTVRPDELGLGSGS
jgi:glutamyl-tRNA synthetase